MKKRTIFIYILLALIGLCIYLFVEMPMFNHSDKPLKDTHLEINNVHETPKSTKKKYQKPELDVEAIAERKPLIIHDINSNTLEDILEPKTQIVTLGDSLTEGVGDSTNGKGYVGILDRTINKEDKLATFYNYGRQGIQTKQLLKRLDEKSLTASIEEANIILLTIGANDVMQVVKENFANLTYELFTEKQLSFEQHLQEILTNLQQYNPNADIYLLGIYNPFDEFLSDVKELDHIVDDWDESGQKIVSQFEQATFIPIKDIFSDHEKKLLSDDNFHPNEFGYYQMAERVIQYLLDERGGPYEETEKYLEATFLFPTHR